VAAEQDRIVEELKTAMQNPNEKENKDNKDAPASK
jgi:hypothetical protein